MRRARIPLLIAALTVLLDQLTKGAVAHLLVPGDSLPLLPPILSLTYVQNTGAAFGILKGLTWLSILLSLVVAAWIVLELLRSGQGAHAPLRLWALSLVLGGAMGNLIDRVWRGHVVDFIDVHVWPVFNVADSAITIGVVLLLWPVLLARRGSH